jgi:AbiU2
VEIALQFFYGFLAIHACAADTPSVHRLLNTAPLFWNSTLGALQTSTFVVLGRIFDQSSPHNIGILLALAENNPSIFSKAALKRRKLASAANAPSWIAEYMDTAHVPKPADFRRLRGYASKHRKTYLAKYQDLRHKVFAHKEITDATQISALFARTNIREMQRMLLFCLSLYDALWQLFVNGKKPVLRSRKISVDRIRERGVVHGRSNAVHERIVEEAEAFLKAAATVNIQLRK